MLLKQPPWWLVNIIINISKRNFYEHEHTSIYIIFPVSTYIIRVFHCTWSTVAMPTTKRVLWFVKVLLQFNKHLNNWSI